MARRRFFVEQVHSGSAEIAGENAQHLTRVLRVEAGQTFEITDNHRVWLATVETAHKNLVRFRVTDEIDAGAPLPEVTLFLALIKFERFEWAVEKAVELGVTRIVPVNAARSERGLSEGAQKRVERWRRIAHEASEQSRRLSAPEIEAPMKMTEALKHSAAHRFWCDERPGATGLGGAFHPQADDSTALIIGPEGGWSRFEADLLQAHGFQPAGMGPRTLRTDTACVALLALVHAARRPI